MTGDLDTDAATSVVRDLFGGRVAILHLTTCQHAERRHFTRDATPQEHEEFLASEASASWAETMRFACRTCFPSEMTEEDKDRRATVYYGAKNEHEAQRELAQLVKRIAYLNDQLERAHQRHREITGGDTRPA